MQESDLTEKCDFALYIGVLAGWASTVRELVGLVSLRGDKVLYKLRNTSGKDEQEAVA